MSFMKTGSPQPLEIVSDMCTVCGKNKAQFNVNGQLVCGECKESLKNNEKV